MYNFGVINRNSLATITQDFIEEINKLIKNFCNIEWYCYVNNHNTICDKLFKDDLHLLDTDKQVLSDNFVFNVNMNFSMSRTFHRNVIMTLLQI